MINRTTFFSYARRAPFGGRLSSTQVDGMERILAEWERRRLTDLRHLAYMLATVFHETAQTMQPIRERGGEKYLRTKPYYPWVGEGLVQVTWEVNHRKFGATRPGQLLDWPTALRALFDGMLDGMFTRDARGPHKLSRYFNELVDDPVGARRIVNGSDKAQLVASYHKAFLDALLAADDRSPLPKDVSDDEAAPDDVRPVESKSLWSILLSFVTGGGGLAFLNGINSWPAVAALALLVVAGGIGVWLVLTGRVVIERRPQ